MSDDRPDEEIACIHATLHRICEVISRANERNGYRPHPPRRMMGAKENLIRALIAEGPAKTAREIASAVGCTVGHVRDIRVKLRKEGKLPPFKSAVQS